MNYFRERCLLAPCNREANEINDLILEQFPGDIHDLWAIDEAYDPDTQTATDTPYAPEVLHSMSPSGFPQAHLRLKIGCPVIVLRNLHSDEGVCNGTRGIVTRISIRVVEILLHGGETCLIPRVKLICSDAHLPFQLHRRQFPLALSFAITINKSQGQSFSTVGIDLRIPAFAHGQVYVAFSRARSYKTVKCILNEKTTPHTKNVVYKEAIV
jgi:ATP-dependent DNA helicase PIF1